MEKVKVFAKNNWKYITAATVAFGVGTFAGPSTEEYDAANKQIEDLQIKLIETQSSLDDSDALIDELQEKVTEAAPWFRLTEEEKKQKEAEAKAAEEKRLAEEQAKKEAEEKARKEAEEKAKAEAEAKEKQGYNTGITYDQLARTPHGFVDRKVTMKGEVVQVIEGDGYCMIRLAVNGDYNKIVYGEYSSDIVSSRVLEDDTITIYGVSSGLYTYTSTIGGKISVPGIIIDKIDQ